MYPKADCRFHAYLLGRGPFRQPQVGRARHLDHSFLLLPAPSALILISEFNWGDTFHSGSLPGPFTPLVGCFLDAGDEGGGPWVSDLLLFLDHQV